MQPFAFAPTDEQPQRFAPIDSVRWQRGKAQISPRQIMIWMLALLPILALLFFVGVAYILVTLGANAHQLPAMLLGLALKLLTKVDLLLGMMLLLTLPVAQWAHATRELRLNARHLELHWRWPWLNHWLGWSVPLKDMDNACLQLLPRKSADLLSSVTLRLPSNSWFIRQLPLCQWAPVHNGQPLLGTWPTAQQLTSFRDAFFMRTPSPAQWADLQRRVALLPLGHALAQRGVPLAFTATTPITTFTGQLNLLGIPALRRGLMLLGLLTALAFLALVSTSHLHFFRTPWMGYAVSTFSAITLLIIWLLPPNDLSASRHLSPSNHLNNIPGTTQPWPQDLNRQQCNEARLAAVFIGTTSGLLCGFVALCVLALVASQAATPQGFTLEVSSAHPKNATLRPNQTDIPTIKMDRTSLVLQHQPNGQTFTLPVGRWGPWWVFDSRPLQDAYLAQEPHNAGPK